MVQTGKSKYSLVQYGSKCHRLQIRGLLTVILLQIVRVSPRTCQAKHHGS